eukprot:CAMPEP_0176024054 /NCGR_PEP_ID=MMETSP0120_2-20121206/11746_1 /TAXON_ID=160619 /ORGANISM="Kryptoperidinium foliaceum, Strain CCMP 1326" /LENGTH=76 /DNA_ID=CAMNT_0017357225 /DNA_START=6 /DNA_END=233 /DNA_ORIENTATION=-
MSERRKPLGPRARAHKLPGLGIGVCQTLDAWQSACGNIEPSAAARAAGDGADAEPSLPPRKGRVGSDVGERKRRGG